MQKPFGVNTLLDTIEDKEEAYSELHSLNIDVDVIKAINPTHEDITDLLERLRKVQEAEPFSVAYVFLSQNCVCVRLLWKCNTGLPHFGRRIMLLRKADLTVKPFFDKVKKHVLSVEVEDGLTIWVLSEPLHECKQS